MENNRYKSDRVRLMKDSNCVIFPPLCVTATPKDNIYKVTAERSASRCVETTDRQCVGRQYGKRSRKARCEEDFEQLCGGCESVVFIKKTGE